MRMKAQKIRLTGTFLREILALLCGRGGRLAVCENEHDFNCYSFPRVTHIVFELAPAADLF